jgi:CDP-diglyceride synthetase
MNWLMNEIKAIPYILYALLTLFIGAIIGDFFASIGDKLFKKN